MKTMEKKWMKYGSFAQGMLVLLTVFTSVWTEVPKVVGAAPSQFNDLAFAAKWQRTDRALDELPGVGRGYTWGPPVAAASGVITEIYSGMPRKVQYFDKARMELNNSDPSSSSHSNTNDANGSNISTVNSSNSLYQVTTGLLVKELVTGKRQVGNTSFLDPAYTAVISPSQTQVAGDPNDNGANAQAPTYASFGRVGTFNGENRASNRTGQPVLESIDRAGVVKDISAPPETRQLVSYNDATGHNVPDVFVDFGNAIGPIWNGSSYEIGPVFFGDPTYVLGLPITEPYWIKTVVGGQLKDVLVQLFERRVLTYTPSNQAGSRVEMGNVGQHYYKWRYTKWVPPAGSMEAQVPLRIARMETVLEQTNYRGPCPVTIKTKSTIVFEGSGYAAFQVINNLFDEDIIIYEHAMFPFYKGIGENRTELPGYFIFSSGTHEGFERLVAYLPEERLTNPVYYKVECT